MKAGSAQHLLTDNRKSTANEFFSKVWIGLKTASDFMHRILFTYETCLFKTASVPKTQSQFHLTETSELLLLEVVEQ